MKTAGETAAKPRQTPGPGKPPELKWLPIDDLHIDHRYQRSADSERSKTMTNRIANMFRWAEFQPLTVCPRRCVAQKGGGMHGYNVVDGQHRLLAAKKRGDIAMLPCAVVDIPSLKDEAEVFAALNRNRVAMTPLAMHHALLASGDVQALKLKEICDEAEITIRRSPALYGLSGPRETQALGALKKSLADYGEDSLLAALMVLAETFPTDKGMLNSTLIKSVACFYRRHGVKKIDREKLIEVLHDADEDEWRAEVKRAAGSGAYVPVATRIAEIITSEYNALVPKAERLVWDGGKK